MGYRDPLLSLPADDITSGNLSGTYQLTGQILAGSPSGSHIGFTATELAFYAADGVTKLIDLDTGSGSGSIQSATINGSTITGGLIQTAASGPRVYMSGPLQLLGVAVGAAGQYQDGGIFTSQVISGSNGYPITTFQGVNIGGAGAGTTPEIIMNGSGTGFPTSVMELQADAVDINGYPALTGVSGFASVTTDVNGRATITHNLGKVPTKVFTQVAGPDGGTTILGYLLTPQSAWSSTQFTIRAVSTAGAAMANTAILFSWEVRP